MAMGYPVWTVRPAFGPPSRLSDADAEVAVMAAVVEAAADGVVIEPEELALIRRRQRGEISREVFLRETRALTIASLWAGSTGAG